MQANLMRKELNVRTTLLIAVGIALTLVSGCLVPCKYPFYEDDQLISDPAIVGDWLNIFGPSSDAGYEIYSVRPAVDEKDGYILTYTDAGGRSGTFSLHLAKFDEIEIADVYPLELPEYDFGNTFYIPFLWYLRGHGCVVLKDISADEIALKVMLPDKWSDDLKDYDMESIRVNESLELVCYDVPTRDFQALIERNLDKDDFWGEIKLMNKMKYMAASTQQIE
jgi:hypothetical protein